MSMTNEEFINLLKLIAPLIAIVFGVLGAATETKN